MPPAPTTSSLAAGVVVLMPTLPLQPTKSWLTPSAFLLCDLMWKPLPVATRSSNWTVDP